MKNGILTLMIAVLLGWWMPSGSKAQNIIFKHLSTDNGLSQVSVNSIYIDERGLVWIATRDGLNCYNGQEIQTFKAEKDSPNSLPSSTVLYVTGDRKGHLYVLTAGGVSEYDLYAQRFKTLIHGRVDRIFYKEHLYMSLKNELFVYNASTANFDSFYRVADMAGSLTFLFVDSKHRFWMGTERDGLYMLSAGKTLSHPLEKLRVTQLYEDSKHNIWVGTWQEGAYRFSEGGAKDNIRHRDSDAGHSISSNFVRCFCEDNRGYMWIGTMDGLNRYDSRTGEFVCHVHDGRRPSSLSHSSVWCIEKDLQGTLWVGTYFGGVNYFNPDYEIYTVYRPSEFEGEGLSGPVVGNMLEDKSGNLWICTEGGGLNKLDRQTGRFSWFRHSDTKNSLSHNNVKAIYYDSDKNVLWIGTHLGGLNRFDVQAGRFTCYKSEKGNVETLPSDIIRDILPYKDSLIVGTQDGVCLFSPATGKCKHLLKGNRLGALVKAVTDLEFDKQGNLWIAVTGEGVFAYDFSTGKLEQFKHADGNPNTISGNGVNNILVDSQGLLWFSVSGGGLDCYNPQTHRFRNYDMKNSQLGSNTIYKVCETRGGELILISNQGFTRFDRHTGKAKNYNAENGFPFTAINENGLYITRDNTVFLGGVDGMISFALNRLNVTPMPYQLYWSKLMVNGRLVTPGDETGILPQAVDAVSEIRLNDSQNMFSLFFASSNYLPENQEAMEYYLEGFSKEWTAMQGQTAITFTNLNPGTYTLKLRASDPHSPSKEICMKIRILPPFYATVWAFMLYVLAVLGIIYYLMRMYKTRVKLRESLRYEQKHLQDIEALNHSKLRFFTSISHEFRTPLTLIVGQLEGVLQLPQVPPAIYSKVLMAYKNSMQLKGLIGELLDFRKQEQGMMKIKVQRHDLIQFLNETFLLFVAYAQTKGIVLEFQKQEEELEAWFDSVQMQKVINNLLSNAIKHCREGGHIVLAAYRENGRICFSVADDGTGIPAADINHIFDRFYQASNGTEGNVGTGIGLSLTKGIVELHHGTIKVESTEGKGSKFVVELPAGSDAYAPDEIASAAEHDKVVLPEKPELPDVLLSDEKKKTSAQASEEANRPLILIVEDNESIRHMLVGLFAPMYRVESAADGVEALEKVKACPPQIILSDVLMPRMSGIELTKRLKSSLDTCHIPIVLLTARTEVEHSLEGLRTGADDYITKPFDSRILISRCNNLVNSRIQLQEHFSKQPTMQTPVLATNQLDKQFLDEVIRVFEKHLEDGDFTIDDLAQEMLISRTRVYGKIKAITGQTPNDFFITLRLKKAAYLLKNNPELNIVSISERTGFNSSRYFAKLFKKAYDVTPMEYRKGNH